MTNNKTLLDIWSFLLAINCLLFILALMAVMRFVLKFGGQLIAIVSAIVLALALGYAYTKVDVIADYIVPDDAP